MRSVRITVDGITYTLKQNSTGEWTVTNRAPFLEGEYPVVATAVTETGQEIKIDVDDPELAKALVLIVNEGSTSIGERMLDYYPEAIKVLLEFKALMHTEGFEFDFLNNEIELALNEAYLTTMGEKRIIQWEQILQIVPNSDDSLEDRRDSIIARIRGKGKLNTALIDSIVGAFTGGTATSYIENSTLYVKIKPPPENKQYKFDNVVRELRKLTPAHLGLSVVRNYATWGEVKDNFASWEAVKSLNNWEELELYAAP